jgi:hypothetical protein
MEDDSGAGVEEERRVAYVGLTRGAKTVHLSSSFSPIPEANLRRPGPPSRFINEIRSTCPDLVEFSAARQQGGYRPMFNSGYGRQRPAVQERPAGSAAASSRPTVASPEAARPRPVQAAGGQLVRRSRPDEGLTP